jgi:heat shock protein HslJ
MRSRTLVAVFVAAVLVTVLAAVGCSGGGSHALDGTSWRLTGWSVSSLDPNTFTITADFAGGKISGKSAVNSYGGSYTAGPGSAFSVGEIASTLMAGPEPEMRAEQAYTMLLRQAKSFAVKSDTLTLSDANGNESLIFTRAAK